MEEIKPFKDQDYALLKSQHNASNLFVDSEFPASIESISRSGNPPSLDMQWKRPKEVFENPQFVTDGFKRNDLHQGMASNCWFISACGAVTLNRDLLARVIPPDQSFDEDNYAGIFHFRFWLDGIWYDVVVDDQLLFNSSNRLIYCRNDKDRNEMWASLLEKAYAKVCGSYEAMNLGQTNEALIDMTAGIDEVYEIFQPGEKTIQPPNFKERIKGLLHQGHARKSMLGGSIYSENSMRESRLANGLVSGHAYSITRVKDVTTNDGETITLVRCRNPWGESTEWKGGWSDNSDLWNSISDEEKERLKYRQESDGEFWMSFDDFYSNFHSLRVCYRGPSSLPNMDAETDCLKWSDTSEEDELPWKEKILHGEWIVGQTAGGAMNDLNKENYWTNPQYLIKLTSTNGDETELCPVTVSLMQKEKRQRFINKEAAISIGFDIYKVNDDVDVTKHMQQGKLKFNTNQLEPMETSGLYSFWRSVTKRCRLPAGTYIIIPSTYENNQTGKFLMRIFTEKELDTAMNIELDGNKGNMSTNDLTSAIEDLKNSFNIRCQLFDEERGPTQ